MNSMWVIKKKSAPASFEILLQRKSRKRGGTWRAEVEEVAAAPATIGKNLSNC